MRFGESSKYLLRGMQNKRLIESIGSLMKIKRWKFFSSSSSCPLVEEHGKVDHSTDPKLVV